MPNDLLTIQMVTREAARLLTNNLKLAGFVNHDYEDPRGRADGQPVAGRLCLTDLRWPASTAPAGLRTEPLAYLEDRCVRR